MCHVSTNQKVPFVLRDPRPVITTTEEGGQVRAAVVIHTSKTAEQDHSKMRTLLQRSPAGSDAEALLSLYQESKKTTSRLKRGLEKRNLWETSGACVGSNWGFSIGGC